jgi:hypothetical protein
MSVIYAGRMDEKRGTEDDKNRKLIDMYRVEVDSVLDEPSTIYDSSFADLPQVGDQHPTDPLVIVKSRNVKPTANRLRYEMEVSYDNASEGGDQGGGGGGGTVEVLQVTIGVWYEDYIQEYELKNGKKGELLTDFAASPIKYEARRPQPLITISSITKDPKLADYVFLTNAVNNQPVKWLNLNFKKDQLMFEGYNASSAGRNTWNEQFVFKGKIYNGPEEYGSEGIKVDGGWQPFILNAGLWQLVDNDFGGKERAPIYPVNEKGDKTSNKPVTEPWPLDAQGIALPLADFREKRVFLNPQMLRRSNFNADFNFDFAKVLTDDLEKKWGV